MELTKEYVKTLAEDQKKALKEELLKMGLDPVYVEYLIYDRDYRDVIKDNSNV